MVRTAPASIENLAPAAAASTSSKGCPRHLLFPGQNFVTVSKEPVRCCSEAPSCCTDFQLGNNQGSKLRMNALTQLSLTHDNWLGQRGPISNTIESRREEQIVH